MVSLSIMNLPKEAEDDEDVLGTEGYIEKRFCADDSCGKSILKVSGKNVVMNRQLPVGLFKDKKVGRKFYIYWQKISNRLLVIRWK